MASTASPFFQSIRESFMTPPMGVGVSTQPHGGHSSAPPPTRSIGEINARLAAIKEKRLLSGSTNVSRTNSRGASPPTAHHQHSYHQQQQQQYLINKKQAAVFAAHREVRVPLSEGRGGGNANDEDDDDDDEPPFDVHHTNNNSNNNNNNNSQNRSGGNSNHRGGGGAELPPGAGIYYEEDILTAEEMACLRVVEIDQHVRVLAQLPQSSARSRHNQQYGIGNSNTTNNGSDQFGNSSNNTAMGGGHYSSSNSDLTVIGDDVIVKIYPRHVVLTKSTGSPLVEFVIAELAEINEHEHIHALDFVLRQKDGSSTVIQIQCPHEPARSAIYKFVCAKRSQLAAAAAAASGPIARPL